MMRPGILLLALSLTACGPHKSGLPELGGIPDFSLTDQTGNAFTGQSLLGSVWVADFLFTNCQGPCPRMSSRLHQIQKDTPQEVQIVSFTIDPARDTSAVLAAYAKEHGATERWHFLTGPQASLHQLSRYAFKLGDVDGSLGHSTKFVLVDRKARIRGYYDSFDPDSLHQLVADVKSVVREPK